MHPYSTTTAHPCLCGCGTSVKHGIYARGHNPYIHRLIPISERFWNKVQKSDNPDGCWIWIGNRNGNNYGVISKSINQGKQDKLLAHRVSYELEYGNIPDGMNVLHKCDNPPCVRPKHLFLGTQLDNIADMVSKNRAIKNRGILNPMAKVTEEQVLDIRFMYATGNYTYNQLAEIFDISDSSIWYIVTRKGWNSV